MGYSNTMPILTISYKLDEKTSVVERDKEIMTRVSNLLDRDISVACSGVGFSERDIDIDVEWKETKRVYNLFKSDPDVKVSSR